MQNTRLNTLINALGSRLGEWLFNPWRRLSLGIISLLFGNFFAISISSIAGQTADLDVVISLFLLLFVEIVSRWVYGTPRSVTPSGAASKPRALFQQTTAKTAKSPRLSRQSAPQSRKSKS
ncbi:MAG: DUF565 domain-containing protein, partial [Cyanobacteria bacterium J06635_15]